MSGLHSCRNLLAAPTVIMMFLNVGKHLKTTHLVIPKSLCFKTYQYMRMSGLKSSRSLLAAPTMFRMVLDVQKHLKTTHLIFPNSFCFTNCLKQSIPGDVRAQVLQEPVGGSHCDQYGPGCPKTLQMTNIIALGIFCLKTVSKTNPLGCLGSGPPGTCRRLPPWSGPEIRCAARIFGAWGSRRIQWYPTLGSSFKMRLLQGGEVVHLYIRMN